MELNVQITISFKRLYCRDGIYPNSCVRSVHSYKRSVWMFQFSRSPPSLSTDIEQLFIRWGKNEETAYEKCNFNLKIFCLFLPTIGKRAKPTKYVSKFIISGIWIVSIVFAIPIAIALRVFPVVEERTCKNAFPLCIHCVLSRRRFFFVYSNFS